MNADLRGLGTDWVCFICGLVAQLCKLEGDGV